MADDRITHTQKLNGKKKKKEKILHFYFFFFDAHMRWHKKLKENKERSLGSTNSRTCSSLAMRKRERESPILQSRLAKAIGGWKKRKKKWEKNKNIGACRLCVNDNGLLLLRLPRVHIAEWGTMSSSDKCPPSPLAPPPSPTLTFVDGDEWTRIRSIFLPDRKCTEREKETKQEKQAKYKIGSQPRTHLII